MHRFLLILKKILKSNSSNFQIAIGIGIGIMVGFLPFYGFQTILAILFSTVIYKSNKAAAILSSQLFIPPIMLMVLGIDYIAGTLILYNKISFLHINSINDMWLYIKPILIGSIVMAPLFGFLSFIISYLILKFLRK